MKKVVSHKGFTLLEVIIATGVTLIVAVFLVGILVNNNGFYSKQNAYISQGLNLNDASSEIDSRIKEAVQVVAGYPVDDPIYFSGTETMVLKLPSYNTDGVLVDTYDYAVFAKDIEDPEVLKILVFPDPQSDRLTTNLVLTTLLNSIKFEYFDKGGNIISPTSASKVRITLSVLSKTMGLETIQTRILESSLRNY